MLEDRAGRLRYGDLDFCWVRHGQDRFEKVPLKPSEGADVSSVVRRFQGPRLDRHAAGGGDVRWQWIPATWARVGLAAHGEIACFGEDIRVASGWRDAEGVFHREKDQFTPVRDADRQPLRGVLCFKADADGTMWMGTRAAGLIRWRNGKMDRIGVEHGLPEREVRGMIEDEQGYFWMPSNRGILRASRKQLHALATMDSRGWKSRYWISMMVCPVRMFHHPAQLHA